MQIILTKEEQNNIKVKYIPQKQHSKEYIEERDKVWNEKVEEGKKKGKDFWDGKLYTLENDLSKDRTKIVLGLFNYSDRLFKKIVGNKYLNDKYGSRTVQKHLWVSVLPITKDKKLVCGIKKSSIGLNKNVLAYISGNINQDELEINKFADFKQFAKIELEEESNITCDINALSLLYIEETETSASLHYSMNLALNSNDLSSIQKDDEFDKFIALSKREIAEYKKEMLIDFKILQQQIKNGSSPLINMLK